MMREIDKKLFWAAKDNDLDAAQDAIDEGANVNAKDDWGGSLIEYALWCGHPKIAKFLRERGATE